MPIEEEKTRASKFPRRARVVAVGRVCGGEHLGTDRGDRHTDLPLFGGRMLDCPGPSWGAETSGRTQRCLEIRDLRVHDAWLLI